MGSGCIAPCILNLSTRWCRVASFTPELLYSWYTMNRRVGRPQSWSGDSGKEKNPSLCEPTALSLY